MLEYLFIASFVALPAGLLMLSLGLHGRQVSGHPFCRRCGYDLHGLESPSTCPECGLDLTQRRAIRMGRRRVRGWLVTYGLALLILVASALALDAVMERRGVEWIRLKPYAWLEREVRTTRNGEAWTELERRIHQGDLSDSQITGLVEIAIDLQDDTDPWVPGMAGRFLESAWSDNLITLDQLRRYLESSPDPQPTRVSGATRCGATFGYRTEQGSKVGWGKWGIAVLTWVERVESRGTVLRHEPARRNLSELRQLLSVNWGIVWVPEDLEAEDDKLDVTVHSRRVALPAALLSASLDQVDVMPDFASLPGLLHDWTVQSSHQLDLVKPYTDPEFETGRLPVAEGAVIDLHVRRWTGIWRDRRGVLHANPLFHTVRPTAFPNYAIDVFWRVGEREWKVESLTSSYADNRQSFLADLTDLPRDVTAVDVILRGNPELADLHPGLINIWVGELIVEDVPLHWPDE